MDGELVEELFGFIAELSALRYARKIFSDGFARSKPGLIQKQLLLLILELAQVFKAMTSAQWATEQPLERKSLRARLQHPPCQ